MPTKWKLLSGSCCNILVVGFLSTIPLALSVYAQSETYVFWTDAGAQKIQRANLDGSGKTDLLTGVSGILDIAVDVTNEKMYWTIQNSKIERANLNGTGRENVTTGGNITGIALDVANNHIYWAENSSPGKISRADLDGSNKVDLVSGNAGNAKYPHFIALDLTNNQMYYRSNTPGNTDYVIKSANLNGSGVATKVTGLFNHGVEGIALDVVGGKVYWTGISNPRKIRRANLNGSSKQDLISAVGKPWGIALDLVNNKLYWADESNKKIQRANLDGSLIEDVVSGLNGPKGITIATIGTANSGISSADFPREVRYVSFNSKYVLMALLAVLGGWLALRKR